MADVAALTRQFEGAASASAAPVALLVVDDECRIAEANLAACRLLGLARDAITDRALGDLMTSAAAERLAGVWEAFHTSGGHAGPFEFVGRPAREPVDLSVTAAVLPGRHLILLSPSMGGAPPTALPNGETATSPRQPTSREREILSMLAAGDTDTQIAGKLGLSPATVQTHVRNAKAKLGARTRAQAVAMALRGGLIADD